MKKAIIIVAVVFVLAVLIFFWYKGRTSRQKNVAYCKGMFTQQLEDAKKAGSIPPLEVYKEQFVDCLKDNGLPDIFIEEAVKENF